MYCLDADVVSNDLLQIKLLADTCQFLVSGSEKKGISLKKTRLVKSKVVPNLTSRGLFNIIYLHDSRQQFSSTAFAQCLTLLIYDAS